ncbi:gp58-like family protein [Streptococcus pluranimalium]|uniref:gp58-like family protein n=1 Tax=Streptococcus pluranimalium TaxID=82348 RepID=UPI003F68D4A9
MKPVLYPKTEKTYVDFGLGEISDALSVEVIRERNGDYSLYMKYPHDGTFANSLQKEMQLKADAGPRTKWQTFDIVRINKKSTECIEVYAKHISFRLEGAVLKSEVTLRNADAGTALALWKDSLLSDTKFDVASDVTTTGSFAWGIDQVSNAREALGGVSGSILDVYGGEYEFDNQLIRLHKQMGRKAPIVLEYGRNIQEIEVDDDDSENYNSILPFAKVSRQEGEKSIDVLTTLPEFYIDGPFIGSYQRRIIKQVDFSSKFDSEKNKPTEDKLRSLAKNYVKSNNVGKPKTTIDVKYVDLASTLDYADMQVIEEVELCDILPLYYPKFGITSANEKVIKTVYDVYNDEYISLTLGTIGQTLRSQLSELTSGKIEALENKQKQFETELPTYLTNASGNRVWSEEPDKNIEHKVGDIWFQNNGLYDRMYIWDGNQWILKIDTENPDRIKRTIDQQFDEFNESYEAEQAKQDQAVKEVLTKATSAEDLANQAKSIGDQAKLDAANALSKALDYKNEAIAEAQRLDTIEREATETKLATTKSQAVAEADKLVNDAKTTLETEISNAKQSIAEAKEALESQISGVSTEVTKTNDTIKTLATKTDVDSTNKRLTSAETTIKQQAGQIAQKANQSAVDMLSGRVTRAETSLTQQADEISLKANTSDVNALTNRVTKAEASVTVNASQIALKANQTEVDSVKSRLQNAESSLTVQANEIVQRVKTSDFNQAKQRLATAESKITQLGDKITTEISETVAKIPTEIGGRNYILDSQTQKVYSNNNILYPITSEIKTENEKSFIRVKRIEVEKSPGSFSIFTSISRLSEDVKLLEKGIVSFKARASHNLRFKTMIATKKNNGTTENGDNREITISQNWQTFSFSLPLGSDISLIRANPMTVSTDISAFVEDFYLDLCDWKLEGGYIATDWSPAPEDTLSEIESVKTTINQTARGQEQLSTQLTQAQGKVTTAETRINQLVGEVSSKVSQTDFNKLNNTVSSQATTLSQQAKQILLKADKSYVDNVKQIVDKTAAELIVANNAINQRVTQTTFNQATKRLTNAETTIKTIAGQIDTKLSRTDADKIVTNAITQSERGTIQRISEVEGKIPTEAGGVNLLLNSDFEKVAKGDSFTVDGQVYDTTATNWGTYNSGIANAKTSYHAYVADYAGRKNAVVYNETNGSRNWKAIHQSLGSRMPQTTNNFILSADVFVTGAGTRLFGGFYYFDKSGKQNFHSGHFRFDTSSFEIGKWQRVSVAVPFEKEKADFSKDIRFYIYAYDFSSSAILAIDDVKLETGKIATGHSLAPEEFATASAVHEIRQTVDGYRRTISEQGNFFSQVIQTAEGIVKKVEYLKKGLSTIETQFADSWAVKHLTSAGQAISEINLGADGINRFHGLLTHISGHTLIDRAVIKDAHIASVSASKMTTGTLDADKVNVVNLNAYDIVGLDADFIKAKIEWAMVDWLRGKTITAQNDAMHIDLERGQILCYTDVAAIKRIYGDYPTQFIKFKTGYSTYNGRRPVASTIIGSNRNGTESADDGGFVGIRTFNGANDDALDVVGDTIRLASSAYKNPDGWIINTLPNRLSIDAYRDSDRATSVINVGDINLFKSSTIYNSLKEILQTFNHNFKHLVNITGRGDVITTWDSIK